MSLYFNEFDRYPAAWLRNLYPTATVDERSIADVGSNDIAGAGRVHFFAGIGGWEYALELAGWPAGRDVWTGSCPCQPFSAAGRGLGAADPRHLWPEFYRLIAECRPTVVFGEQVAGAAGRAWLSAVRADLEAIGYAVGAADLCAAGVGAPHIRQRIFWGAWLADADGVAGRQGGADARGWPARGAAGDGAGPGSGSGPGGLADAVRGGRRAVNIHRQDGRDGADGGRPEAYGEPGTRGQVSAAPWADAVLIPCLDGKARPVGAGLRPLAHGVPARASKLRAYGNAIVPQVAAAFIAAYLDAEQDLAR